MPDDDVDNVDNRYPPKSTADGMLKSNKQEMISKTEELRRTSGLLLASNDALKSKTEELEKTNKALFESNHELAFVNKELAATNTRFAETNERFAQVNEELAALIEELALSNEQIKARDKILTDFVNLAAHEFRTPTQSILGYSELLQLLSEEEQGGFNGKADHEKKKALESIIRNANRLDKLATNILDVTRIDGNILILDKQRFNLNEKIRNVVSDIVSQMGKNTCSDKNIRIAFEPKAGAKEIYIEADELRVSQVISNLLSNAVKFTKEGNITITADANTNGEVVVKITDTGTGIATDILPRLFSKFATGSSEGVGLGLFISKSIVEAHGGRIWAGNNDDTGNNLQGWKGATFAFSLPYLAN
jgi:signal transduction histidine kinase